MAFVTGRCLLIRLGIRDLVIERDIELLLLTVTSYLIMTGTDGFRCFLNLLDSSIGLSEVVDLRFERDDMGFENVDLNFHNLELFGQIFGRALQAFHIRDEGVGIE